MLEGRHYQNAYITRDVTKGAERVIATADVRLHFEYEGPTEVMTPQGPVTQVNKMAFIWIDDLQIELIEPVADPAGVYTPFLPDDDSLRFHHFCMRLDDWDAFRPRVDEESFPVAIEAVREQLKFLYLDMRGLLGHHVEYVWMTDDSWAQLGGR